MATNNAVNVGLSGSTGSGNFVGANTPTLITPVLGAATATSISFGGSTLSTYVTGTWTPVLTFATAGDLNVVYSAQVGRYTQIGNRVIAQCNISTSTFTYTTASGAAKITGLPVTSASASNSDNVCVIYLQGVTKATYTQFMGTVTNSASAVQIVASGSGVSEAAVTTVNMPSGTQQALNFTLIYEV